MIRPDEISEAVWRAGMSAYHKTLRKTPGMAWQTAAAEILNVFFEEENIAVIEKWKASHDTEGIRRANIAKRLFSDD